MAIGKSFFVFVFLILAALSVHGQSNRYMVFFKDKTGSPFSVTDPQAFLSQRAIDRRQKQGISISDLDLPVNSTYVQGVRNTGAEVYFKTRWLNGVLVQCDQSLTAAIAGLSYVDRVELVAPDTRLSLNGRRKVSLRTKTTKASEVTRPQLEQLNMDDMHSQGFRGEGLIIGVFDAGFLGVDVAEPFSAIVSEGRINLGASHDFVFNSNDVFQYDDHGTEVFSVIAAQQDGVFTGGAYKAKYQLYVTEDVTTEYRIEEYNWLFAAERADSAGVDVVNSSLGYNDFDDDEMDYPKTALDGKTAVVTRAAQLLADRGVLIVCSAGNEGNNGWQLITAPADAVDILAVGSVDLNGLRAPSSSRGPSADNRIKPDVVALGVGTSVIQPNGSIGMASGTSLAAPLITSFAAGVWQKYPQLTNKEIMMLIRRSGALASAPNNLLGHGIPNFIAVQTYYENLEKNPFDVYPNPFIDSLNIKPFSPGFVSSCTVSLVAADGRKVFDGSINFTREAPSRTIRLQDLGSGIYILRLQWENKTQTVKITKP